MSPSEIKYKSDLIERIKSIQDKEVLEEVNRLLDVNTNDTFYKTSDEQKQEIKEALNQLAKGQGIPSEEANREIEVWLSK